jgi:CrcB protein
MSWLLVGAGGAMGAMARHALNRWILTSLWLTDFPAGIFLINVGGSGLIGVFAGIVAAGRMSVSADTRLFLSVGILGGFTTFSSFSLDTLALMKAGHVTLAVANVLGQVVLSLLAVLLGYRLGLLI